MGSGACVSKSTCRVMCGDLASLLHDCSDISPRLEDKLENKIYKCRKKWTGGNKNYNGGKQVPRGGKCKILKIEKNVKVLFSAITFFPPVHFFFAFIYFVFQFILQPLPQLPENGRQQIRRQGHFRHRQKARRLHPLGQDPPARQPHQRLHQLLHLWLPSWRCSIRCGKKRAFQIPGRQECSLRSRLDQTHVRAQGPLRSWRFCRRCCRPNGWRNNGKQNLNIKEKKIETQEKKNWNAGKKNRNARKK